MYYKKYSQDIIDKLVNVAASLTPIVKPSIHLNKLYRTVSIGMYNQLKLSLEHIERLNEQHSNEEALMKIEHEARNALDELAIKMNSDIDDFEKQSIEYKMSCVTKHKLLDVLPSEYDRQEILTHKDKESVDIEYVTLTKPLRKRFTTRFKKEIQAIEQLVLKAELLANKR